MPGVNVLVIFASCSGATEKLALAAAVGAVQARANIRLRRLPDDCAALTEDVVRMRKEYVTPTSADARWADAVIIAINHKIGGLSESADPAAFGRSIVKAVST